MTTPDDDRPAATGTTPAAPTRIRLCPDGPLLVRGPVEVVGADGSVTASRRATSAVCRCGRSAIAPWCDGSHRLGGPRRAVDERGPTPRG